MSSILIVIFINCYYIDELIPRSKKFCSIFFVTPIMQYFGLTIGYRQAEKQIKSVLHVKQHKRVNNNSLNELFLLNMYKQIDLLPPTRYR